MSLSDRAVAHFMDGPAADRKSDDALVPQQARRALRGFVVVNQALISHPEAERILDAAKAGRTRWTIVDGYGATAE